LFICPFDRPFNLLLHNALIFYIGFVKLLQGPLDFAALRPRLSQHAGVLEQLRYLTFGPLVFIDRAGGIENLAETVLLVPFASFAGITYFRQRILLKALFFVFDRFS
jgi:hypothetical protein